MNCNSYWIHIFYMLSNRDQIKESRGSVEAVNESNVNKLGVEGQVLLLLFHLTY